jgi:hypothetical protein
LLGRDGVEFGRTNENVAATFRVQRIIVVQVEEDQRSLRLERAEEVGDVREGLLRRVPGGELLGRVVIGLFSAVAEQAG